MPNPFLESRFTIEGYKSTTSPRMKMAGPGFIGWEQAGVGLMTACGTMKSGNRRTKTLIKRKMDLVKDIMIELKEYLEFNVAYHWRREKND
jgi:hypothetical protein